MARSGIEQLLYAMDRAFQGDGKSDDHWENWHSFLVNLASVDRKDWLWLPRDGRRTIFELVQEVGMCKYVYDSQAFGDGSIDWNLPETLPMVTEETPVPEILGWLKEGQRRLRGHVEALADDSELLRLRRSPQGPMRETRWIVTTTIEHDIYHAGEVNHLRALVQGND